MIGFREDYYVVVQEGGGGWSWEIGRKSVPMGVKVSAAGFRTRLDAKLAGDRELKIFLNRVMREMNAQAMRRRDAV